MLGKGYLFQIHLNFPLFAETSISYAFVFIAVFYTLKIFGSDAFVAMCDLCKLSRADFAALVK